MNGESSMVMEKSWDMVPGHLAPATVFICFGSFALFKTLQLAKDLPPGRTFTQTHIPFRDLRTVGNIGTSVMVLTVAGALYHSFGEGIDTSIVLHMTLYSCFFMIGLVAYLESKQRLMPDSGRAALALGLFLAGTIWRAHGMLMSAPISRSVHVYLGYINFADAFAFGYSIMHKDSILSHIISWALMVLQGLWLYFIAFYLCCFDIEEKMVEADLCLLTILVTIIIALVVALSDLPQVRESHNRTLAVEDRRGEYEVLAKLHNDDHCLSGESEATAESEDSSEENC